MSNKDISIKILNYVGGNENVSNCTHCATRLRLNLFDDKKINMEEIKKIDGVITVQIKSGQLQVVLGGKVEGVYNEFTSMLSNKDGTEIEHKSGKKRFGLNALIETVAGIFSPTLPVLIGCGMIMSVTAIVKTFNIVPVDSGFMAILNMTGDLIFYFLPFFLAISAARKFKTNEYMAVALAGAFMYPTIMNGAANVATTGIKALDFLGLPILFVNYKSTVFPIIISVYILSHLYRFVDKLIPEMFKILFVPLIVLSIMVPLQLIVLGPISSYLGVYIAEGVKILYTTGGFIGAFALGVFRPILVMFGMHYAITPIMVQEVAQNGKTIIIPALLAGNLAQSGAAFATSLLIKDKKDKSGAISAGFTAFLGITEPAMYGYNLKYKKPFYAALIAAGIAAAYMSIFNAFASAVALPGALSLPNYKADSFIHIIIGVCISVFGAFALTLVMMRFSKKKQENEFVSEEVICSPIEGTVVSLKEVNDPTFAEGALGNGIAIIPSNGKVVSPVNGVISALFPSKHAIGITSKLGAEILIHVGLETVNLEGNHYTSHVKIGDNINVGDLLLTFEKDEIKKAGYDIITPVLITNSGDFKDITFLRNGLVKEKDNLVKVGK